MLPNDAHAVPFRLAVRPKPCLPVSQAAFSSTASLLSCLRCTHRHLWWDRKEAIAKARDEAVDPFHGPPIPQTLASKISSSAIERDAVALVASWGRWLPPEARFVADSPLEGDGFEPSVSRHESPRFPARIPARSRCRQSEPQPPFGSAQPGRGRPVRRRK